MRRREFLAAGSAAAGVMVVPKLAWTQPAAPPIRYIDAHCHISNASDLPIVGFVEKAVLPNLENLKIDAAKYRETIRFYLTYLAAWVVGRGYSASTERDRLIAIANGTGSKRTPEKIEEDEIAALSSLIEDLRNRRPPRVSGRLTEQMLASIAPQILIGLMHREAFPDRFWVKGYDRQALNNNADGAFTPENWSPSPFVAQDLYRTGRGPVTFYAKWALHFTRFRFELANELHAIHARRSVLLTPALIDYSRWLDVNDPTPLADQIEVMAQISRQKIEPGTPRVHGFVAFDPLRQLIHEKLGRPVSESPMALVERAIEGEKRLEGGREIVTHKGFIGVKLYPPMGFRAAGNVSIGTAFPCSVRFGSGSPGYGTECTGRTNARDALGNTPGKLLDDVLARLYAWCVAHNVPILTHTNNFSAPARNTASAPTQNTGWTC